MHIILSIIGDAVIHENRDAEILAASLPDEAPEDRKGEEPIKAEHQAFP
jgi:hypothetical protein